MVLFHHSSSGACFLKAPERFCAWTPTLKVHCWKTQKILRLETLPKCKLCLNAKPVDTKSSVHQRLCGFWNGFSGPKTFQGFWETGPWCKIRQTHWALLDHHLIKIIQQHKKIVGAAAKLANVSKALIWDSIPEVFKTSEKSMFVD